VFAQGAEAGADVVGQSGEAATAQPVLDEDGGRGPDGSWRRVEPWTGGLTKLERISEWAIESGSAPASSWWSNGSWNWPQANAGRPSARAITLRYLANSPVAAAVISAKVWVARYGGRVHEAALRVPKVAWRNAVRV